MIKLEVICGAIDRHPKGSIIELEDKYMYLVDKGFARLIEEVKEVEVVEEVKPKRTRKPKVSDNV